MAITYSRQSSNRIVAVKVYTASSAQRCFKSGTKGDSGYQLHFFEKDNLNFDKIVTRFLSLSFFNAGIVLCSRKFLFSCFSLFSVTALECCFFH